MRILIIHNYYQDLGGEDIVFQQEVAELRREHEVFTLIFKNRKGVKGLFQFLLSPWNVFAARKVKRKIAEVNADIVHFHNTQYACGPLAIRHAKKAGKIVVMSLHNFRLLCPSATLFYKNTLFTDSIHRKFPWLAIEKNVLDNSKIKTLWTALSYWIHRRIGTWNLIDRYFVLAEFSRQLFISSTLPVDSDKFVVKPNFVDMTSTIQSKERGKHFLYVGRLSPEKGITNLLQAIAGTDIQLKIAGTGPQTEEVKSMAIKNPNLDYLGMMDKSQIIDELKFCKGLIVPSVCYEGGVPLTIIEAFATCTPVIASNIGAIPDVIIENETGFLFDPHKADTIIHAITQANSTPTAVLTGMSLKALDLYQQSYTPDIVIRKLTAEYEMLIKDKS